MPMFIKLSKRVKKKLPMVTPGQADASILPSGGNMSSGWNLDYRAIQIGDNNQVSYSDDEWPEQTPEATGECFRWAYRGAVTAEKHGNSLIIVHAIVTRPEDDKRFAHAWLEDGRNVIDENHFMPQNEYYAKFKPIKINKFNAEEAMINAARTGHYGPWDKIESNKVEDDNTKGRGSFVGSKEEGFPLRRNMSFNISKRAYPDYPAYSDSGLYSLVSERMPATPAFNIFDTYFADDKPRKPFKEFIEELRAKNKLVNDRIVQLIATGQKTHKFSSKYGHEIIVHPSTRHPGKWQMTWFSDGVPTGHLDCETQAEALKEAHRNGADIMSDLNLEVSYVQDINTTEDSNDDVVEVFDEDTVVDFTKQAFVKTAVTYDSNPVVQNLIKIPQIKSLIDQQASGYVDKIVVTTPGADFQQTQQQLKTQPGQSTEIKPIEGNPYGHMWMTKDPNTHQSKPLDKIVRIDRVTDEWGTLVTILHEIAHHRHPDWSESQVQSEAEQNAGTVKQYLGVKNASAFKKKVLFVKNSLYSLPLVECDLADTYQKQVIGLQNHSSLRPESGMLFTYGSPQHLSFWMGTVKFPIDIIFVGADNRILKIYRNCAPKSNEIYSCASASKVIEVVGSFCAFHDLNVGDHVFEANDENIYEQESFTKYIMEKIKEIKLEQQEDLGMTDWNIKIVLKKEPDSRRFLKVNWEPGDYKLKKADLLVNPDPILIREAVKEVPLEILVRHALLHILTGHKKELPEDREYALITSRLFTEE